MSDGGRERRRRMASSRSKSAASASGPSFPRTRCFARACSVYLDELGDRNVEPDRLEVRGRHQHSHVARASAPALAGPIDVPAAVHPHVRAQHESAGEVHQQVLADAIALVRRSWPSADGRRARASAPETPTRSARRRGPRARGAASPRRDRWCRLRAPSYAPRPKPPWRIWKPIAEGLKPASTRYAATAGVRPRGGR